MISFPVGALAGENDKEALSSATAPIRSCPDIPAEDEAKTKAAAMTTLCRNGRFMIRQPPFNRCGVRTHSTISSTKPSMRCSKPTNCPKKGEVTLLKMSRKFL
jgi:hypothetical protein